MATTIQYQPAMVGVSDERGEVAGAKVTMGGQSGTVIPPEGDSLDCWMPSEFVRMGLSRCAVDAIASCALRGARGKSGQMVVEE